MSKTICKHLERTLPQLSDGFIEYETKRAFEIQRLFAKEEQKYYEKAARDLEKSLNKFGLETFRIEVLMDKYVSHMSLQEIADKRGYVDSNAVYRLIKSTLRILQGMGFGLARQLLKNYKEEV